MKEGALSLDNCQNLVYNEAFTSIIGNIGVFFMHKGAVPIQGRLGKLRRVLKYLKVTKNDKRIMGYGNLLKLETWVDESRAVHEDMRGHTGGYMSFGVGITQGKA